MTISSTARKAGPFSGTGAQKAYPFNFKVFTASDLLVVLTDAAGVEHTLTLNSDYAVALNADQEANPGGTITLPAVLPIGQLLTFSSAIPLTQGVSIPNMGGFYPKVVEQALDKLTIAVQQTADKVSRAMRFAFSDTGAGADLPTSTVRAGKFLAFDAGGNPTAASGTGADAALRTDLAAASSGAALVGFIQRGIGAILRSSKDKLRESVSVMDYGAKGDGVTDDSAAIQAAFDACAPGGRVFFPQGRYFITIDIRITKPVRVVGVGPGSYANDLGSYLIQSNAAKNAFTLVAATANYAFGQYGIVDVHFADLAILGPSNVSRALAGIGVDTTVNGGDFHVRDCSFANVRIRYFQKTYALTGIVYLNNWWGGGASSCGDGAVFARGNASDVGGQNRFFGWSTVAIDGSCISYFEDTSGGDIGLHGCTLSESGYGFRGNQETKFYSSPDCMFESNAQAGVYFKIPNANPNTSATKTVGGKFLTNGHDVWIDKTTAAYSAGGFYWPMCIDDAYLGSASGLYITVPAGHVGIDSAAFTLGRNIAGPNNGQVAASQISSNFMGTDERKFRITRRFNFDKNTVSGGVQMSLPAGFVILTVKTWLTANNTGFTGVRVGNQVTDNLFAALDGGAGALNTPVVYAPATGFVVDGSKNQIRVIYTAAANTVAGVVEVDGYIQ